MAWKRTSSRRRGSKARRADRPSGPRPAGYARPLLFELLEGRRMLAADFGDAPAPYPTLLADNGARHEAVGPTVGALRDADLDGMPSAAADGDGPDDDGVTFGEIRVGQLDAQVTVNVQNAPAGARLDAWIDFNNDGSWGGAGERVFAGKSVVDGDNLLTFHVPSWARSGEAVARFRLSTAGGLGPGGAAADGEVEDYWVTVVGPASPGGVFGEGRLVSAPWYSSLSDTYGWAGFTADLDGDGDLDILSGLSTEFLGSSQHNYRLAYHLNDGTGRFSTSSVFVGTAHITGVLAADLDGDGDLDAITASSSDNTIAWYANNGPYSIPSSPRRVITTTAIGAQSVFAADVDGDGDIDVLSASANDDKIAWHENDGDGNFVSRIISASAAGAQSVVAADLDRDGDLDVLSASYDDDTVSWYENDGSGAFVLHTISTDVDGAAAVSVADLDGDGDLDVFSAASLGNSIMWHENDGAANFTTRTLTDYAAGVKSVRAADLDGDGDPDILAALSTGFAAAWIENHGGGSFTWNLLDYGSSIRDVIAGDVDGDGDLDAIAIASYRGQDVQWYENLFTASLSSPSASVAEDTGDALVFTFSIDGVANQPRTLAFAISGNAALGIDYTISGAATFDGSQGTIDVPVGEDSVDLVLTPIDDAYLEAPEYVTVTLLESSGAILAGPAVATQTITSDEVGGDFGDAPAPYSTLLASRGAAHNETRADGPRLGASIAYGFDGQPSVQAEGDLDDDGVQFGMLRVGAVGASVTVNVQGSAGRLDGWIDFNGDGSWGGPGERVFTGEEVAVGDNSLTFEVPSWAISGATYARFRLSTEGGLGTEGDAGDGEVEDYPVAIEPPVPSGSSFNVANRITTSNTGLFGVAAADLDGDGDLDLVSTSYVDNRVQWYQNTGSSFSQRTISTTATGAGSVTTADVDGDGDLDVIAGLIYGDKIEWYENRSLYFVTHTIPIAFDGVVDVTAADLDHDGDIDFLASSYVDGTIAWYENDGQEVFTRRVIDSSARGSATIYVADLDRDGELDILSASYDDGRVAWHQNDGAENFTTLVIATGIEQVTDVLAADFDGDGDLDIASSSIIGNRADWYENDGANNYTAHSLAVSQYGASNLHAADVDGDGDTDLIAAGNLGENDGFGNFTFRRFATQGSLGRYIASGDVDQDGDLDFVALDGPRKEVVIFENSYDVRITSAEQAVSENAGIPLAFDLSINRPVSTPRSLLFEISGEAQLGFDFSLAGATTFDGRSGTIELPAGATSAQLVVTPLDDGVFEFDETVTLTLLAGPDYFVAGTGVATHVILSNEYGAEFGDAPAPYRTSLASGGPLHLDVHGVSPRMGPTVDFEPDGQPSEQAGEDVGDDGVVFGPMQVGQLQATVLVTVQGAAGQLDAWIDFNGDGAWGGPGEQVSDSKAVVVGDNLLTFDIPSWAVAGATYARFRVSTAGGLGVGGLAADGEVEDYQVLIESPDSPGGFFESRGAITTSLAGRPSVFAVDLDRDGDLDILTSSYSGRSGLIQWHENNGAGGYTPHKIGSTGEASLRVFAADVDGDGDLDVLAALSAGNAVTWFENDGSEEFVPHNLRQDAFSSKDVFVADIDADGDLDILFITGTVTSTGRVAWYENDGDRNFSPRVVEAGGVGTSSEYAAVYAADIDNDGDLDILTALSVNDRITWYENDGNQNFTSRVISSTADGASSVFARDLDGDGDLDVLSASAYDGTIAWFENDGEQNFTPRIISTTALGATEVFAADLDGDGDLDVLSASADDDTISWYENDGDASFLAHTIVTGGSGVSDLFVADVDGDGDLDVLYTSDGMIAWHENVFELEISSVGAAVAEDTGGVLVFDFSTGRPTSVAWTFGFTISGAATQGTDYTVSGAASFDGAAGTITIAAGEASAQLVVYPLDDQLFEVDESVTVTLIPADGFRVRGPGAATRFLTSDESGAEFGDAPTPYPTLLEEGGAVHFQGSGSTLRLGPTLGLELLGQPSLQADSDAGDDGVTLGPLRVGRLQSSVTINVQGAAGKLDAWIDYNGDGSWGGPDEHALVSRDVTVGDNLLTFDVPSWAIVGATYARFRLSTAGGLGIGGAAADGEVEDYLVTIEPPLPFGGLFVDRAVVTSSANGATSVVAADLDGDGDMDLVSASYLDNKIAWYENNGAGVFLPHIITTSASGARSVIASDVDGDGDLDVLSASNSDDTITWYENNGAQSFTPHTIASTADGAQSVFAADVDSDGDLDVLSASYNDDRITWYENNGAQSFTPRTIATTADGARSVYAADLDHDGDLDVLAASFNDDKITWYENDGAENFIPRIISSAANGASSVLAADIDGDGHLDVVSASSNDDKIAWYENNGAADFTPRTISTAVDYASSLFVADVDGDGDPDVLAASENDDKIAWYENDGDGLFTVRTITTLADGARSVLAADLDGDGDLDVISASYRDNKVAWYENAYQAALTTSDAPIPEESGATLIYTFTISRPAFEPLTLFFNISGLATSGSDYSVSGAADFDGDDGSILIPKGADAAQLVVTPIDDALLEFDETIVVRLLADAGYVVSDSSLASIIITSAEVGGDYGDAPAPYPTLLAAGGATHNEAVSNAPRLGINVGHEPDGQPSPLADADNDDGVSFSTLRVGQSSATVAVNVQGAPGRLDAWIDFNGDGSWDGAGERVFLSVPVVEGDNLLSFDVPVWAAAGATFARFRVSTAGGLGVRGAAGDGEVEDYRVQIEPPPRTSGVFDATPQTWVSLPSDTLNAPLITVDLDGDGDLDYVATNTSNRAFWGENLGDGSFIRRDIAATNTTSSVDLAADLDGDGDVDLVGILSSRLTWWENDGAGGLTARQLSTLSTSRITAAAADYNGDGRMDLAVAHSGGNFSWFEGLGGQSFQERLITSFSSSYGLADLRTADLDGDGDLDLVLGGNSTFGRLYFYRNNGQGAFTQTTLHSDRVTHIALADFDRDGDIDIAAYGIGIVRWHVNHGLGVFTANTVGSLTGTATGMAVADFNGDGAVDIAAIARPGSFDPGGFVVYENEGSGQFSARTIPLTPSSLASIDAADADGDGAIDLIVGLTNPRSIVYFSQPPLVSVEVLNPISEESADDPLVFRISVASAVLAPHSAPFTIGGSATVGLDYTVEGADSFEGAAGVATIPAGQSFVDIVVRPIDDGVRELTETVQLALPQSETGVAIGAILGDPDAGDYGDAPAPYRTTPDERGAAHLAVGPTLGAERSTEQSGAHSTNADGDSGDDGALFGLIRVGQANAQVVVNVQNAAEARLDAWIDFNGDGSWNGAGEQVYRSVLLAAGDNVLTFAVPGDANSGVTYARLRLSTAGGLGTIGDAADGEVEDYQVTVTPPNAVPVGLISRPLQALSQSATTTAVPIDFDGDGDVDVVTRISPDGVVWFENTGGDMFVRHTISSAGRSANQLAVGDLDGDGDLDVAFVSPTRSPFEQAYLMWLRNDGEQVFTVQVISSAREQGFSLQLMDLDDDGDLDLLTTSSVVFPSSQAGTYVEWHENDGAGGFTTQMIDPDAGQVSKAQGVDLDGDGDLDVVASTSGAGGVVWYQNDGDSRFLRRVIRPHTDNSPVIDWNRVALVSAADLDLDGDLDLIPTLTSSPGQLIWLESDGAGVFTQRLMAPGSFSMGLASAYREVATGDLDGDGDLDLIYGLLYNSAGFVQWVENRITGDLNDDGEVNDLDIAFWKLHFGAKDGEGLRADANGDRVVDAADYTVVRDRIGAAVSRSFLLHIGPVAPYHSMTATDLDGDGDLDVFAAGSTLVWLSNSPTVSLAVSDPAALREDDPVGIVELIVTRNSRLDEALEIGFQLSGLAVAGADFTIEGAATLNATGGTVVIPAGVASVKLTLRPIDDGLVELGESVSLSLVGGVRYVLGDSYAATVLVLGDEQLGDFGDAAAPYATLLAANGPSHSRATADDPRLGASRGDQSDAVPDPTASGDATDDGVVFGELRVGALGATVTVNVQGGPGLIDAWIDFNADGAWGGPGERILASAPVTVGDNVLRFDVPSWAAAGATFARFRVSTAGALGPMGPATDGEVEDYPVAIAPPTSSSGAFSSALPVAAELAGPTGIAVADLDGDGDLDVVSASAGNDTIAWHENDGQQNYATHVIATTADGGGRVLVIDLDGDGDLDIVAGSPLDDVLAWFENDGAQNFTYRYISNGSDYVRGLFAADIDGDGDLDLLTASSNDSEVAWYENNGSQLFTRRIILTSSGGPWDVTAADIDRDGDLDVLVAATSSGQIRWYENDGAQGWTARTIVSGASGVSRLVTADLDGDGDLDILTLSYSGDRVEWHENDGAQNFATRLIGSAVDGASDLFIGDTDGDGDLDIVATSALDDSVRLFENDGLQQFSTRLIASDADGASSVALADMDGDGDLDILSASQNDNRIVWYENGAVAPPQPALAAQESTSAPYSSLAFTEPLASGQYRSAARTSAPVGPANGAPDSGSTSLLLTALDAAFEHTTDRDESLAGLTLAVAGLDTGDTAPDEQSWRESVARCLAVAADRVTQP